MKKYVIDEREWDFRVDSGRIELNKVRHGFEGTYTHTKYGTVGVCLTTTLTEPEEFVLMFDVFKKGRVYRKQICLSKCPTERWIGLQAKRFAEMVVE